jgi:hypothetical protein
LFGLLACLLLLLLMLLLLLLLLLLLSSLLFGFLLFFLVSFSLLTVLPILPSFRIAARLAVLLPRRYGWGSFTVGIVITIECLIGVFANTLLLLFLRRCFKVGERVWNTVCRSP